MSVILKGFWIDLSKKQTAEINRHLDSLKSEKGDGFFVLAQSATKFGHFDVINGQLQFAVITAAAGREIAKVLEIGCGSTATDPAKQKNP